MGWVQQWYLTNNTTCTLLFQKILLLFFFLMVNENPSVLLLLFFVSTYFINDKGREGIALYTGGVQQVHHHQEFKYKYQAS